MKINWPLVCTIGATAGVITTAGLAIHDTLKAADDIDSHADKKIIVKHYIPTMISGIATIGLIITSDALNETKLRKLTGTGIAGAGLLAAREFIASLEPPDEELKPDEIWIFEDFRRESDSDNAGWFKTTLLNLFAAEYELNRMFTLNGEVYLNDFYFILSANKPRNAMGEVYCWTKDFCKWIDFQHEKVVRDDGSYYYILTYPTPPIPDYKECY